ncbi:uncharacterized protein [Hetaerina americana]|uniref:uncharacterized protein n=1 Tax=Hetaerina americana TaxID=62018 RepID=UPI003A7F1D7F
MNPDSWKSLVHSSYWTSVTSHVLEESGSTAFISTKEGSFIEFHKGVIERSCLTDYCSVQSIELFFTYHPYRRYFLLKEWDKLIIISDQEELKIEQVHSGVSKYEIGDFNGEGKPEIQVWSSDDAKEPFILNISTLPRDVKSVLKNPSEDFLSCRLQLKLKETKDVLAKFTKEVEEKRRLRRETLQRLALNCPLEPCPPPTELQRFFGDSVGEDLPNAEADSYPLQIHHSWQTTFSDKWLLGLTIRNSDHRRICNMKVFLNESPKQKVSYSVKRLNATKMDEVFTRIDMKTLGVFPLPAVAWQGERVDSELPPGCGCVLIIVLRFPEFLWSSKKVISGRLSYYLGSPDDGDVFAIKLPQFEVTPRSILDGSLLPQGPHKQFLHTISAIAMCKMVTLTVTMGITPSPCVEDILTAKIGFSCTPRGDNFFVHPGSDSAALGGCMIQIIHASDGFTMQLYARSHEILCLLVYCVLEACPGSWNVTHNPTQSRDPAGHSSSVTLGDCSDALSKEIRCIIYSLSKWRKDDSLRALSTDVKSYINFRKEITAFQEKTDDLFSKFEHEAMKGGYVIYH